MKNKETATTSQVILEVPEAPHLEPEALAAFDLHVRDAYCYLEYGCGGSTVRAAQLGAWHIIAVDSSKDWTDAVSARTSSSDRIKLLYCDIGPVGQWGRPRDTQGLHAYHAYMSTPWQVARRQALEPNVILVDGRFRVACFLYSLLCAQAGTVILFDDYVNRPQYHVVEQYNRLHSRHGKMAVFKVEKSFSLPDLVSKIAEYSIIAD